MSEADPADREAYRYWNRHVIRFADLDPAGHVNNVAYAQYFESGRVAFWRDAGRAAAAPGATGVIARLVIDYRTEMDFPGEVEVGTRVLSLGNSSCRMGQGLFRDGGLRRHRRGGLRADRRGIPARDAPARRPAPGDPRAQRGLSGPPARTRKNWTTPRPAPYNPRHGGSIFRKYARAGIH